MSRNKVLKVLESEKDTLRKEFGVVKIGLFGSYARGDQKRNSDVDLFVSFDKNADLLSLIGASDYLGKKLRKKVDIVTPNGASKRLVQEISGELINL